MENFSTLVVIWLILLMNLQSFPYQGHLFHRLNSSYPALK